MTKEQQIKIQRCIDEFYSNRPQVRDELGVALQVLYEAEPIKHGRWINERVHNLHNGEQRNARECSECGAIYFIYDMANAIDEVPRYCPNCGARMDEVEE